MLCPEKITGTYLRLNGFLLAPHFTIFSGASHKHIDLLALRPPGGKETVEKYVFPVDVDFFRCIRELKDVNPHSTLLGAVVEVKGGDEFLVPDAEKLEYARQFLGDGAVLLPMAFLRKWTEPSIKQDAVIIPLRHALDWILNRIEEMNQVLPNLKKNPSWYLSEGFLGDLLYLNVLDFAMPEKSNTISPTRTSNMP